MTTELSILARAPTRIDLAGGTVDIWPIYLFLESASTINLAIDLLAEARLTESPSGGRVRLRSEDQDREVELSWSELDRLEVPPALELHLRLVRHFARERRERGRPVPTSTLALTTLARSPAGAGLGGSSALAVSIAGALLAWSREGREFDTLRDGEGLLQIVRDAESAVIRVPAGLQDYYAAAFGGLQALRWRSGTHARLAFPGEIFQGISERIALFYSGQSRNSGINNWTLFKGFIDGDPRIRERFEGIVAATRELEGALHDGDWNSAGQAIAAEWRLRRELAPGITTPEVEQALAIARDEGAVAGKVCGAGGGGCFFAFFPDEDPRRRARLTTKISSLGIRPLAFNAVHQGLEVRVG